VLPIVGEALRGLSTNDTAILVKALDRSSQTSAVEDRAAKLLDLKVDATILGGKVVSASVPEG